VTGVKSSKFRNLLLEVILFLQKANFLIRSTRKIKCYVWTKCYNIFVTIYVHLNICACTWQKSLCNFTSMWQQIHKYVYTQNTFSWKKNSDAGNQVIFHKVNIDYWIIRSLTRVKIQIHFILSFFYELSHFSTTLFLSRFMNSLTHIFFQTLVSE